MEKEIVAASMIPADRFERLQASFRKEQHWTHPAEEKPGSNMQCWPHTSIAMHSIVLLSLKPARLSEQPA